MHIITFSRNAHTMKTKKRENEQQYTGQKEWKQKKKLMENGMAEKAGYEHRATFKKKRKPQALRAYIFGRQKTH